ncbi:hypothetical protein [Pseudoduganella sp. RAF53_2]|uniref:hypothetical protein n=1 Tax=unclassified Pseudoduganella TaxID=2637179 RepID=UPI003F9B1246
MSSTTFRLSDEADLMLTELADRRRITKMEAIRRGLALLPVADEEDLKRGNQLAIVDKNFKPVARINGVL